MTFSVGVGKSNFADIRQSNNYYVDKTELIYDLVHNTDNMVTLFTRPRRFGKTLMMSMMENFFNIRKDSGSLFEGLDIIRHEEFCKEWMNQYPVIFISFKDVDAATFEDAYDMLKSVISDECRKIAEVIDEASVDNDDKELFARLKSGNASLSEIKNSIKTLMRLLFAVYGKQVILLIDEYDVPLAKASERDTPDNKLYSRMLDVIKGILSSSLKDNEYLKFSVITGCLRIAKESIFTGTNNFVSYSVLDDWFSQYFGFSETEVVAMLDMADRREAAEEIKEWYDGYVFGRSYLYCPWDVINHISAMRNDKTAKPKNYWKNTSHNGILLTFVKRTDFDVTDKFEVLLNGGKIVQRISDELTYDTLHSSEDNLWSVLLMTGYITKADPDEEGETVSLKIPNKEIASIFEDTVVSFFEETVNDEKVSGLMNALWNSDMDEITGLMSDLLWDTISYNDYHEDYYHAFLAGILVGRGYSVESNKEKGLGRPDILLKDKKNRRAIIIEAKISKKESDMDDDCDDAIQQIIDQKYSEGLTGYEQVLCYGVAFFRKQAKAKILSE